MLIASFFVIAVALIAPGAVGIVHLALVRAVARGFAEMRNSAGSQTLVPSVVEPAMRGRVRGQFVLINRGGPALAALVMGALADRYGFALPLSLGAILWLPACLFAVLRRLTL